jgi:hypothetical protein
MPASSLDSRPICLDSASFVGVLNDEESQRTKVKGKKEKEHCGSQM